MKHKYHKLTGFTVIELMITVAVAGVLMAVAIPSFSNLQKDNCLTTSTNTFVTSLQQARSEAVKRRTNVTLTASSGISDNEWGTGWTITLDEDRNSNGTLDAGEDYNGNGGSPERAVLVRTVSLGCTLTKMDGDQSVLVYGSNGFIDMAATINVCDDRTGERDRQITISNTGRPNTNSSYTCS